MTKDDLIDRADKEYKLLCKQVDFIGKPKFITFTLPTLRRDIDVTVIIKYSRIYEILVKYKPDNIQQIIRPE